MSKEQKFRARQCHLLFPLPFTRWAFLPPHFFIAKFWDFRLSHRIGMMIYPTLTLGRAWKVWNRSFRYYDRWHRSNLWGWKYTNITKSFGNGRGRVYLSAMFWLRVVELWKFHLSPCHLSVFSALSIFPFLFLFLFPFSFLPFFFSFDKISFYNPVWLWPCYPPASASGVLVLQACAITTVSWVVFNEYFILVY